MRRIAIIMFSFLIVTSLSACSEDDKITPKEKQVEEENKDNEKDIEEKNINTKLQITVGFEKFTATLQENATATAFKALLPMTLNMSELNNNEKYYSLPNALPTHSFNPGTIQNGDLMLYGSTTLVLFYKTFSTSYSYTRIGQVDNPSELQNALGSGSIEVTFEI